MKAVYHDFNLSLGSSVSFNGELIAYKEGDTYTLWYHPGLSGAEPHENQVEKDLLDEIIKGNRAHQAMLIATAR